MNTYKVVYNSCWGGFGLSDAVLVAYNEKRQKQELPPVNTCHKIKRDDLLLVELVEEFGDKAFGCRSELRIKEIPNDYGPCHKINECDGLEMITCDPGKALHNWFKNININELSDQECKKHLIDITNYINRFGY